MPRKKVELAGPVAVPVVGAVVVGGVVVVVAVTVTDETAVEVAAPALLVARAVRLSVPAAVGV